MRKAYGKVILLVIWKSLERVLVLEWVMGGNLDSEKIDDAEKTPFKRDFLEIFRIVENKDAKVVDYISRVGGVRFVVNKDAEVVDYIS